MQKRGVLRPDRAVISYGDHYDTASLGCLPGRDVFRYLCYNSVLVSRTALDSPRVAC